MFCGQALFHVVVEFFELETVCERQSAHCSAERDPPDYHLLDPQKRQVSSEALGVPESRAWWGYSDLGLRQEGEVSPGEPHFPAQAF